MKKLIVVTAKMNVEQMEKLVKLGYEVIVVIR